MDDFNLSTLTESRNEYSALLVSKITPCIIEGFNSIFDEACNLCIQNDEDEKYLMTFQNFLGRVTKWNSDIIQKETERIISESNCVYLEDLLTCVYVTQLKILTNVRTNSKQKKVTIDIPKINEFIHKCYIEVARKVYKNVFLYDRSITPLSRQKNLRELELIIKECILHVIRNNMPIENILKSYLEEDTEETVDEEKTEVKEVEEPIKEPENEVKEPINETKTQQDVISIQTPQHVSQSPKEPEHKEDSNEKLQFDNTDKIKNYVEEEKAESVTSLPVVPVNAPKDIQRLEELSEMRNKQRKEEEEDEYDSDESEVLKIHDDKNDDIKLDIEKISSQPIKLNESSILGDIEVLQ